MKEDFFLSIVIPAYNEESNIGKTLSEISGYLKNKKLNSEVILADDGSKDSTVQEANAFKNELPNLKVIESKPNRGKGYVLKKGMLEAEGDLVLFMDADSATSIKELDKFIPFLDEDYNIFIASRRVPGARVTTSSKRKVLGSIYILFSKIILGLNVNDINCGFKIFRKKAAKNIFSKQIMDDWSFDAEDLFLAKKNGYKIKEIPVEWIHGATSKVNPLRDGINSFISLVKIRINDLKGKYK